MPMKSSKMHIIDDDEDLYTGFNEISPALDTNSIKDDENLRETLRTAGIGRTGPSRHGTGFLRLGTSFRLGTASSRTGVGGTAAFNRPVTAVRAAGYTSATSRSTPSGEEQRKEDTIEDKVKLMEEKIMRLIEESCILSTNRLDNKKREDSAGVSGRRDIDSPVYDLTKALAKAQEASALEKQLIKMQDQTHKGDSHNLDLSFAVLCNLAGVYSANEMYTEALNTYQLTLKNKLFPQANRLKVNMGNIYFKMGEHPKALKFYRMALDQAPTSENDLRMKIMHNIGLLLVRMGKFRDAVGNLQHMMQEQPDMITGLHLVLCSVALQDSEAGKAAFNAMLDTEPPSYHMDLTDDNENIDALESVLRDVLRSDRLSTWSRQLAAESESKLIKAATALAPLLDSEEEDGMTWCVNALRGWEAGRGAGARLELSAALSSLRYNAASGAAVLSRIKAVVRANQNQRDVKADANADAAFVAYALSNYAEAKTLADMSIKDNPYGCGARVTSALATAMLKGDTDDDAWRDAAQQLSTATHLDPSNIAAVYNLALAQYKCGELEGAASRFARVRSSPNVPPLLKQNAAAALAVAHHGAGDVTHADYWYGSVGTGACDIGISLGLARLHAAAGDENAEHNFRDVESVWPCDVEALSWLAEEAKLETPANAANYYYRLATLEPNNPNWGLQYGACLRSAGKYQEALKLYKRMHLRFPDNISCLRMIVRMCGDQGLSETTHWSKELQQLLQQQNNQPSNIGSASSRRGQSPLEKTKLKRSDSSIQSLSRLSSATSNHSLQTNKLSTGIKNKPSFDDELPLPFD